jgi:hypothetical protein
MARCNAMHIDQLRYVNAYIDMASEKYVCYEGEVIGDSIYVDYGNSLCQRIVTAYYHKQQDEILPCLIEKIKDTTFAAYYGNIKLTLSDIAIVVTAYILGKNYEFSILEFCEHEFGIGCGMYNLPYAHVFKTNASEENYRRRMIYYNTVRKIYEEAKKQTE